MPIGTARLAEPDPGVSVDAAVLTAGAVVIVVLAVARVARTARRLASGGYGGPAAAASAGRSKVAGWLAGAGAPVTAAAGVRLALEPGRGRTAVPVRSALAGTALSVLAVTAAFTFGASLLHLVHTPRLYGQTWDAAIDMQFGSLTPRGRQDTGSATPPASPAGPSAITATIGIGGHVIPAIGLAAGQGPLLSPTLLQGRPPRTGNEIVLGTSTLRQIGRHVGQTVTVTVNGHRQARAHRGPRGLPELRPGQLHPDRSRPGRRDHRSGAEDAGRLRAARRAMSSCCCVSRPARAGRPTSPASSGPCPDSARPCSNHVRGRPTSARTASPTTPGIDGTPEALAGRARRSRPGRARAVHRGVRPPPPP